METRRFSTPEQAKSDSNYLDALKELLFQLADDDFIISYRGSEWLGLAPHIEEDVAFSSISQDTMGHAVMYYELLEQLGAGRADDLAHLRNKGQFRNALLVERPNGPGHYYENPRFDWAYTMVRFFMYEQAKVTKLSSLTHSSYLPLSQVSHKIIRELYYHLMHWEVWMKQLAGSTKEAKNNISEALGKVWPDLTECLSLGSKGEDIVHHGLIESSDLLLERFLSSIENKLGQWNISLPGSLQTPVEQGRNGIHTNDLQSALDMLAAVYRLDPAAHW